MENNFKLDLSQISDELRLILEIINKDKINESMFVTNMDWKLFMKLAKHHRLYPALYQKLKNYNVIPDKIKEELKNLYCQNAIRMLYLGGESEIISTLFKQHKIRALFLKGPTLSSDLYGDVSLRSSTDLDILVPLSALNDVEMLLLQQGYIKDDYILTVLNDWKWRHHHYTYFHPEKRIKVEIHWRLNPGPAKEPSFEELWRRKQKSTLTHSTINVLGEEDLFFFLVSHGARHGWSRLRWLLDIHQLIMKRIDWKNTYKLLKKYKYLHIGGQALILSSQLLHSPLEYEVRKNFFNERAHKLAIEATFYFKQMVNLHNYPIPKEVELYHKRHLFSLMSFQQKFLFILSFLYPYPIDVETLPLPKGLHFLYFPLHPLLWVWRKSKRQVIP
ncbi:MAG: nucleotidyltransferase domain-containing protein [Heyndrickxia sp.]